MTERSSERGAILVMVAVCLLGLMAFSAIVMDYGVMWSSRGQAQNAADGGAHAAAVNLLFNSGAIADAVTAAKKTANINLVWGAANAPADVLVQTGLTCPPGSGGGPGCVRVDVLRGARDRTNTLHTNYLPVMFSSLFGVTQQGVLATATAQIVSGNAISCVKPWIVADKWQDNDEHLPGSGWDRDDTYTAPPDVYNPLTTGFRPSVDTGLEMPLKPGNIGTWSAGWAMEIDYPSHTGSAEYKSNVEGCPDWVPIVTLWDGAYKCDAAGDTPDPLKGCVSVKTGMSQGPTTQGVDDLISMDSSAVWVSPGDPGYDGTKDDPDNLGYVDSPCMNANTCKEYGTLRPMPISPRIVPIAAFDTASFVSEGCSGSNCVARIRNLIGFFIEGMCSDLSPTPAYCGTNAQAQKTVIGRLMRYPGQGIGSGGPATSSFTQYVRLVR